MRQFQKRQEKKKEFSLKIDVLNYAPAAYQAPQSWIDFQGSIGDRMKQILDQTNPDEMNDNMFDALIDAAAQEVRTSALRQRVEHFHTIRHNQNVLLGELAEVHTLRQDLDSALEEITQQLKEESR